MKKKRIIPLIALAAAIFLFSGCARSDVGVVIEKEEKGTVEISLAVNEKYAKSMTSLDDSSDMSELFGDKETQKMTFGEDSYLGVTETKKFESFEELETILLDMRYDFAAAEMESNSDEDEDTEETEDYHIFKAAEVIRTSDFLGEKYSFSVTTMAHEAENDNEQLSMLGMDSGDIFKLVVSVTMPGEVTSEAGTAEENKTTFTVTDFSVENTLTATSESSNTAGILIVFAAIVIITIILIFLLFRKKTQNINLE